MACNDFLSVENPGAVETPQLDDPKYISLMVNGVVGEFQPVYPTLAYYGGVFVDELRNHHVFFEEGLIDQRAVLPENATYATLVYNPLQRTRFLADTAAEYIRAFEGDSASRDLRLARVQAYGGLTYTLLAESLCNAPINLSAPKTPQELLTLALQRFDDAIAIGNAAKAYAGATAAQKTSADSLIYFARIGAGRAALQMGDKTKALAYATGIPIAFEFRAYYSENSARENNSVWNRFSNGSGNISGALDFTPFETTKDPRVPHPVATEATQNGIRAIVPNAPRSYSSWDSTTVGLEFTKGGFMRLATGLEARYIVAEAERPTAASITFVEQRRALDPTGNAATPTTAANFYANLLEQRGRDFFLSAHRLGDLRRFKDQYGIDRFPSGPYPGSTTGESYGTQTCFPLSSAEIASNPNVPKT